MAGRVARPRPEDRLSVIKPSNTACRGVRALAAVAAIAVTVGAAGSAAWGDASGAAPSTSGATQASLQVQAQELAAQIQADGRRLDQMAEAVNAATLRSQQLTARLAALQTEMDQTQAKTAAAKDALKQQAVMSYIVGGAPAVTSVHSGPASDPSLAISYAEIVTGSQKRAIDAYRSALAEQAAQAQQVTAAQNDAAVTLQQLVADRSAAAQADASRRQALSQVTGQMATLVANVQAAQQAAAQAAVLTSTSPSAARPAVTAPAPQPTSPTTRRSNPPAAQPVPTTSRTTAPTAPTVRTTPTTTPGGSSGGSQQNTSAPKPQAPGANKAIAYARAQLGKPYQWGGAGPDSFDCSGLTMMAWEQAGVYFPHLAQDQYDMTQRISISQALPGDLIFFGTPGNVYHVGLYIGNGQMIDAPETGQTVSIQSIYWSALLGAGRVTG